MRLAGKGALWLGAVRDADELAADAPALLVALGEPGVLERRQQPAGGGGRQVGEAGESAVLTPRGKRPITRSSAMAFVSDWVRGTLIS